MKYKTQLSTVGLTTILLSLVGCTTPPTRAYPLSSLGSPVCESVADQCPFVEYLFRPRQSIGPVITAIDGKPAQFNPNYGWFTRKIIEPRIHYQAFAPPGVHHISFRRQWYEAPSPGPGYRWVGQPPINDLSSPEQTVTLNMRPGHFYRLTEELEKGRLHMGLVSNTRTSNYILSISEYDSASGAKLCIVTNVSLTFTSGIDTGKGFHRWISTPTK